MTARNWPTRSDRRSGPGRSTAPAGLPAACRLADTRHTGSARPAAHASAWWAPYTDRSGSAGRRPVRPCPSPRSADPSTLVHIGPAGCLTSQPWCSAARASRRPTAAHARLDPKARLDLKMQADRGPPGPGVDPDEVAELADDEQAPAAVADARRRDPAGQRVGDVPFVVELADQLA